MPDIYEEMLAELDRKDRLRALAPREGHDFASNDYLGLAESPELRQAAFEAIERGVPVGAGASRLLRGNHPEHEALEAGAASFFGCETALFFSGGFVANWALFATLPQRGDLVVHDALIHASAHQGMRAGRAEWREAAHNDAQAFDDAILKWRADGHRGRPWIAVETLYGMDGDRAPLAALMDIAERYDAMVVADEAHATGVFGPDGRGLCAQFEGRPNVLTLHTCGKALGVSGALICARRSIRDFLVNRCKPFIYATAPSPLTAATVRAALRLCRTQPERRLRLWRMIEAAGREFEARCGLTATGSQIFPVIAGSDKRALGLAAAMRERGYDMRAIRPPTVPDGTARLRIALTLNVGEETAIAMIDALGNELQRLGS